MTGDAFSPGREQLRSLKGGLFDLLTAGSTFVLERKDQRELRLNVRFCRTDELEDILLLQKLVYDGISDKDTFVLTTAEEFAESLDFDVCIGAYDGEVLVAFTLMVTYPYSTRNLGLYLGYDQERCAKCVTYDTTFVDPAYKGYGLQRMFIRLKDQVAIRLGAEEALATVSIDNSASLNNLRASGFGIVGRKKMYGGFDRLILRKMLNTHKRFG
jgi:hypothetical protein